MKKILVFLVMMSVLIGVMGMIAATTLPTEGVQFTVNSQTTVGIEPQTLDFGAIVPGAVATSAINGPISFSATGSNTDITVEFTSVDKTIFNFIELEIIPQQWVYISTHPTVTMLCNPIGDLCNYSPNPKTVAARLAVPTGTPAGVKTGIITYTITGQVPTPPAPIV